MLSHSQQVALALIPKISGSISIVFSSLIVYTIIRRMDWCKKASQWCSRGNRSHIRNEGSEEVANNMDSDPSTNGCRDRRLKKKDKPTKVYDRIVLGVSIADLLGSTAMAFGTWPIPSTSNTLWAVGTQTTCTIQGVFTMGATIASALYMGSIATYFLLVIYFGWRENKLRTIEWLFHLPAVLWGLCTGIATVPLKLSNDANLWCFIAEAPNDPTRGANAEFYRMIFFYGPLFFDYIAVTILVLIVTVYVRRLTTNAMKQSIGAPKRQKPSVSSDTPSSDSHQGYCSDDNSMGNDETNFIDNDDIERADHETNEDHEVSPARRSQEDGSDIETPNNEKSVDPYASESRQATSRLVSFTPDMSLSVRSSSEHNKVSFTPDMSLSVRSSSEHNKLMKANQYYIWRQKVSMQNIRFAVAFYWTWTPISCVRMIQLSGKPVPYWLIVLATITTPMQGLPNLLVYFYPKYKKALGKENHDRKRNPFQRLYQWIGAGLDRETKNDSNDQDGRHMQVQTSNKHGNEHAHSPKMACSGEAVPPTTFAQSTPIPRLQSPDRRHVDIGVSSVTLSGIESIYEEKSRQKQYDTQRRRSNTLGLPPKVPTRYTSGASQNNIEEDFDDRLRRRSNSLEAPPNVPMRYASEASQDNMEDFDGRQRRGDSFEVPPNIPMRCVSEASQDDIEDFDGRQRRMTTFGDPPSVPTRYISEASQDNIEDCDGKQRRRSNSLGAPPNIPTRYVSEASQNSKTLKSILKTSFVDPSSIMSITEYSSGSEEMAVLPTEKPIRGDMRRWSSSTPVPPPSIVENFGDYLSPPIPTGDLSPQIPNRSSTNKLPITSDSFHSTSSSATFEC